MQGEGRGYAHGKERRSTVADDSGDELSDDKSRGGSQRIAGEPVEKTEMPQGSSGSNARTRKLMHDLPSQVKSWVVPSVGGAHSRAVVGCHAQGVQQPTRGCAEDDRPRR